jgi:hypothetical protein
VQAKIMMRLKMLMWFGALATVAMMTVVVAPASAQFGVDAFDGEFAAGPSGGTFTTAGGHPYSFTTTVELNHHQGTEPTEITLAEHYPGAGVVPDGGMVKDILVDSPPGLIGNPSGMPHCTAVQLAGGGGRGAGGVGKAEAPSCPVDSQVGVIRLKTNLGSAIGETFSVYNMVPPPYAPARFGFQVLGTLIVLDANVRNGGDFGITVVSHDISESLQLWRATLTLWGVPADPGHDSQRCSYGGEGMRRNVCGVSPFYPNELPHHAGVPPRAFLRLPTSCPPAGVGLQSRVSTDSWENPGVFATAEYFTHLAPYFGEEGAPGPQQGPSDCEREPFDPSISVQPTNHQADTPTGLEVEVSLPQEGLLNPTGIGTSDLRKAVVALPAGESVSPSAADGLGACSLDEIGLTTGQPAKCPDSSKLGTVQIETPVLEAPLSGSIFLGKPECGPCTVGDDLAGQMVKLYIVVEGSGVILKLPGRVELDPVTGEILTTFDNNPQLPFSHLKLNFKAGPRSPLVNPHTCGTYETKAVFTPWSGNPPAETTSSFEITSGPGGKPCPTSTIQGFAPGFAAGTTNNQAGAFSPLAVTFSRADGEQQLGGVTVKTPPGLLGSLSAVSLCREPAASQGSCPASSEIGSLTVAAGAGANPFYVTGGKVFLTGAYKDGQFGLSIVVPAKAGPFDLGTVIVRGSVLVDPITAALTVTTDPLPTILDGIPLDLRSVNVTIGKSRFIFNPTNCNPLSLYGTLTGGLGTVDPITNSFQVTNCAALGFKPIFHVSTSGKTSRLNGASLDVKLSYPAGSMGTQSNIGKVKVDLPKQLPSRLTTLQKACPDSVFNANPAACPPASRVGQATATTPIIPEALSGPAFFVSHGGAQFPELVIVLSGYGVSVQLHGETFINEKTNVTSSTFRQIPDVPIGTFELKLPQGPNSALAANGNLCKSTLKMPTAFIAQDGTEIHQSTHITPTGCPKAKKAHKANKHHGKLKK